MQMLHAYTHPHATHPITVIGRSNTKNRIFRAFQGRTPRRVCAQEGQTGLLGRRIAENDLEGHHRRPHITHCAQSTQCTRHRRKRGCQGKKKKKKIETNTFSQAGGGPDWLHLREPPGWEGIRQGLLLEGSPLCLHFHPSHIRIQSIVSPCEPSLWSLRSKHIQIRAGQAQQDV